MRVIYEPKGPALEYSPLAANLYKGCEHACKYCYAPDATRTSRDIFISQFKPRPNILVQLERDAGFMAGDPRPVLLCFTSDPYQPIEEKETITRKAIRILGERNMKIRILTKNGPLAMRDLDLYEKYDVEFGTTLLFTSPKNWKEWEPNAAPVPERVKAIVRARHRGIRTWVSMEPVIIPGEALALIDQLHQYVDIWKVGKLNHFPEIENDIDWTAFLEAAIEKLTAYNASYFIKDALWKYGTPGKYPKERYAGRAAHNWEAYQPAKREPTQGKLF